VTTPSSRIMKVGRGKSYLLKHLSYEKRWHLVASPAKMIFCELSPFKKKKGHTLPTEEALVLPL